MPDPAQCASESADAHLTVLVVDDEPMIRELVSLLLEEEGYTVRQAADGLEALREVDAYGIDLVLSDVKMPHLDGVSLAFRLCAREHTIPVVLMSAVAPVDKPVEVPFLRKPFAVDQLTQTIASMLSQNASQPVVDGALHQVR